MLVVEKKRKNSSIHSPEADRLHACLPFLFLLMAHIGLLPFGSAGDVLPFLWLGRLLKSRGHRVTMVVSCVFADTARNAGLEVISLGSQEDFDRFIADPRVWQLYHGTRMVFEFAGASTETFFRPIAQLQSTADHFDLLLAPATVFGARLAREKFGIALITVHLQPAVMISAYEPPVLFNGMEHFRRLPLWLKQALISVPNPADRFASPAVVKACQIEGVPPPRSLWWDWANSPDGSLCLFPEWFAQPQPDWPANIKQWDFPLEDLATERPLRPELQEFLEQVEKPIVFTPGSANIQAERFFRVALEAVTHLKKRAIFITRKLAQLPPDLPPYVLAVEYAAFSTLLPKCAVFVHHGGIGTLSQALAAGIPQLIMAMAHDQPDNAYRIARMGAGLTLTPRSFTVRHVTAAILRLSQEIRFKETCQKLALRVRDIRPSDELLDWIEARLSRGPR